MPAAAQPVHPDWGVLGESWELALDADGYAPNTRRSYPRSLATFAVWCAEHADNAGPLDVRAEHVRRWIIATREASSSSTARARFAGLRHFFAFLVAEGERSDDPTRAVKTPAPNDQRTPILSTEQLRALLGTCTGRDLRNRRDRAILLLFADGGLRLSELAGLRTVDVDVRDRITYVVGKGSRRSGPRRRAVPVGVKTAQALDRYLRERRRHPYAATEPLWLGDRGRATLSAAGIKAMVTRRAATVGIKGLHAHQFRHTFAHNFRMSGGNDGDLMVLGGWRSRAMLDRYGATGAADRAREAAQRLSLGDRL